VSAIDRTAQSVPVEKVDKQSDRWHERKPDPACPFKRAGTRTQLCIRIVDSRIRGHRGYLHCRGVAGVNGRSCDVGCFTRVAFDSGGHRSHGDKPDRRWRADLFVYRHEPQPAFLRNPTASGGKMSRHKPRAP
jgi:hypothetical protein